MSLHLKHCLAPDLHLCSGGIARLLISLLLALFSPLRGTFVRGADSSQHACLLTCVQELVQLIELVDEGAAAVSSLASSAVGLPSWRDADGWKRFCFGPSPGALQKEGGSGKHNGAGEGLREEDAGEEATRLEGERPVLQKQELGSADSPRVKPNQVRTEEGGAESGLLETEQWGASRDCQEICGTAEAAENGKQEEQLERESLAERAEPFPRLDVVSVRPPEEEEHAQPLIERQPGQGGEGHGRDKPRRLPSPGAADAAGAAPRSRGASPVGTRNGEKEADLRQAGGRAASAPCDVPAEGGTAGETRGEEAGPPSREEALFQEHSVALSKLLIDHDGPAAVSNGLETTAFVSSGQAEAPQEARGGPGQGEEAVAGASGRADGPLPRRARRRAEKREPLLEAVLPFLGILLRMDPVGPPRGEGKRDGGQGKWFVLKAVACDDGAVGRLSRFWRSAAFVCANLLLMLTRSDLPFAFLLYVIRAFAGRGTDP